MKKSARKFCSMVVSFWVGISLCFTTFAQELKLPAPTQMVSLSIAQSQPLLRGVKINPDNPLQIEFIVDKQQGKTVSKEEINRLVSYFMAALTIPEEELWVNLSPYEQNRIIPNELGQTAFGEGLLAQDYFLKQLASSLTYPESDLGKNYWQMALSGKQKTVNTFNKIWIVPQAAEIYENGNIALITKAKLKIMSEEDYLAQGQNKAKNSPVEISAAHALKQLIIPQIEKEVNTGANFSELRQIFCSYMLAKWFKNKLKDSFYSYYINQKNIKGIDLTDKTVKDKIYNRYIEAFKKGVYNYIKKDYNPAAHKITKRQYFSGGIMVNTQVTISHDRVTAAQDMAEGPFPGSIAFEDRSQGRDITGGVSRALSSTRVNTLLVTGALLTAEYFGAQVVTGCGSDTAGTPIKFDASTSGTIDAPVISAKGDENDGGASEDATAKPKTFSDDAVSASGALDAAAAASSADAPNVSPANFQLTPTQLLAGNNYLKNLSGLVSYANKNFKSGVGYPSEGLIKLTNALMSANQTLAYGTALADQIRATLNENSQAALVITAQFDPLYLAALAIELNKQPSDLLDTLYSLINELTTLKANPPTGYVADSDKEKVLYVLAIQYGTTITNLFKQFPKLVSDLDYPFVLSIALQILGYQPAAGDSVLDDLTVDYQNAKTQLGAQATRDDLKALVLSWHGESDGVNIVAMAPAVTTFFNDQNTLQGYGISSSVLGSIDLESDRIIAQDAPHYASSYDGGSNGVGSHDMTDIDTASERAKIAKRRDVMTAKEGWRNALVGKSLPVQRVTVNLILPDNSVRPISTLVAYVENMPDGLRATLITYSGRDGAVNSVVVLPSEEALLRKSKAMLEKARVSARQVLADRLLHEVGEKFYMGNHVLAWFTQIRQHGGDLTPEQRLQIAEHEGDQAWEARMEAEGSAGRDGHEAMIKGVFGNTSEVNALIAKNKRHFGGVNLKTEIKTSGDSKAITFKLSPRIVEQFKKNGLRFDIVKFGYGVSLQDMFNGR